MSYDNASVTNIFWTKRLIGRPQEALLCAKAKRQLQMFYLCESEASATKRPVGTEINHTLQRLAQHLLKL